MQTGPKQSIRPPDQDELNDFTRFIFEREEYTLVKARNGRIFEVLKKEPEEQHTKPQESTTANANQNAKDTNTTHTKTNSRHVGSLTQPTCGKSCTACLAHVGSLACGKSYTADVWEVLQSRHVGSFPQPTCGKSNNRMIFYKGEAQARFVACQMPEVAV